MTIPRTGVWLFPSQDARELVALAEHAESAGLDELWLGDEGPARDPFALLAAVSLVTERLRLGIAVTNPYVRLPAIAAASALTLQELSGGRVSLGFGKGGGWALHPLGVRPARPFADTERALRVGRAVAEGVPAEGYVPPAHGVGPAELPLFVGSRGERLNRFASRYADGVFLGGIPIGLLDRVVGWARSARAIDVAVYLNVAFTADDRERARPELVRVVLDSPAYVREHFGLETDALQSAAAALNAGDQSPARALISDAVLDEYVLRGDSGAIAEAIARIVANHRPTSIGLALGGADLAAAVTAAADVLGAARGVPAG